MLAFIIMLLVFSISHLPNLLESPNIFKKPYSNIAVGLMLLTNLICYSFIPNEKKAFQIIPATLVLIVGSYYIMIH